MDTANLRKRAFVVLQYSFYPVFLLGTLLLSIVLLEEVARDYWFLIPAMMTAIVLPPLMLAEKKLPYRADWQGAKKDSLTDIIRTFVIFPVATLLALFVLSIIKKHYPLDVFSYSPGSGTVRFIGFNLLFFLVSDFCYYWVHRAFHRARLLWPFHAIHHGAKRVYSINSGKFHFLEACVSSLAYFSPMLILGASEDAIVLAMTLSLVTGFLEHANINFRAGILNYVFNTAELHRWHHSTIIRESNTNFGKMLSVWDLCFGTFWFPRDKGVAEVGIENEAIPDGFMKQLTYPFKKPKR